MIMNTPTATHLTGMSSQALEAYTARICLTNALARVQTMHRRWMKLEQDPASSSLRRDEARDDFDNSQDAFGRQWKNLVLLLEYDQEVLSRIRAAEPGDDTVLLLQRSGVPYSRYGGYWDIRCNNRYAEALGSDEALWTIARLLMGHTEGFLRTEEEHRALFPEHHPPLEPWQRLLAGPEDTHATQSK